MTGRRRNDDGDSLDDGGTWIGVAATMVDEQTQNIALALSGRANAVDLDNIAGHRHHDNNAATAVMPYLSRRICWNSGIAGAPSPRRAAHMTHFSAVAYRR